MRIAAQRGALIVFEGCDRSGKTTAVKRLVDYLNDKHQLTKDDCPSAKMMRFPDRGTHIGQVINDYLKGEKELDDHVIHLLFSTNRWEKREELTKALDAGQHVLIDRYAYSGVAFSAAKAGMDLDWCRGPDRGLPKPGKDIVHIFKFYQFFITFLYILFTHTARQDNTHIERLDYLLLWYYGTSIFDPVG